MQDAKERLVEVLKWSKLKQADFARETGIDKATISRCFKMEGASLSKQTLDKLAHAFPEISKEWINYGRGEMLASKTPADKPTQQPTAGPAIVAESDEMRELKRRNRWLEEQVELWQRIALSGVDMTKLAATGTEGPGFNSGNQNAADDYTPQMRLSYSAQQEEVDKAA